MVQGRVANITTFFRALGVGVCLASTAFGDAIEVTPLPAKTGGPMSFSRLDGSDTGLSAVATLDPTSPESGPYLIFPGAGIAAGDYDDDGRPDLFIAGHNGGRLYRQTAAWQFSDVTEQAGLEMAMTGRCTGVTFVDVDNDRDLDLFVCRYMLPSLLFVNQGNGNFIERTAASGLTINRGTTMAAFADYDRDGDLDVYLMNYAAIRPDGWRPKPNILSVDGRKTIAPEQLEDYFLLEDGQGKTQIIPAGQRDALYRNNGDGTFVDVTAAAGLPVDQAYHGLGVRWIDFDSNGLPDLFVGNDLYDPDFLYLNVGNGTFREMAKEVMPHTTWYSMGADAGDINNDGRPDLFVAEMAARSLHREKVMMGAMGGSNWFLELATPPQYMRNALYLNTGAPRFAEIAYMAGVGRSNWTWSALMDDLDGDGRLDIFCTNGLPVALRDADLDAHMNERWHEILKGRTYGDLNAQEWTAYCAVEMDELSRRKPLPEENVVFRNIDGLHFEDHGADWGLSAPDVSTGAVAVDLDRDGDLDLVTNRLYDAPGVYRNNCMSHSVLIRLQGRQSNRFGIGAVIRVVTAAGAQVRELATARGYMSSGEPLVHLGLGNETHIAEVTVHWPGGCVQRYTDLPVDVLLTISETAATPDKSAGARVPAVTPIFVRAGAIQGVAHQERPFNDFATQPLLPNRMSQLGPGMAWGDLDADGRDDLVVGAAAGKPTMVYRNQQTGRLAAEVLKGAADDAESEDMAPLLFDADSDGDLDLFIASGTAEHPRGSAPQHDRLYLNDGSGTFTKSTDGVPALGEFSGPATLADFDRDGDLDLFVGGRAVPGEYPTVPKSRLLQNTNGHFADVTDALAPALRAAGMVSGATWTDLNGDGWMDLILAIEWGCVRVFLNENGRLADATDRVGLSAYTGWWLSVSAGDIDGDGDLDLIAGNFGLNTKYSTTPETPVSLYYGDFDNSGRNNIVEAIYERKELFPVRGRSCSSRTMPFIAGKFPTYNQFAQAPLVEIYTAASLAKGTELKAAYLDSMVFINDGTVSAPHFQGRPLPGLSQAGPLFGTAIADIDGDGFNDVVGVQNFFSPQPETGRFDGGIGICLRGSATGLQEMNSAASGLVAEGDCKALTLSDLNEDGGPELIITRNHSTMLIFSHVHQKNSTNVAVRLKGPRGNLSGIGSRVTFTRADGSTQLQEMAGGSGYLSQSSQVLFFGLGTDSAGEIVVQWPDGAVSRQAVAGAGALRVAHPSAR